MKSFYQNTGRLIRGIESILENRCSLSDHDVALLKECIVELKALEKIKTLKSVELKGSLLKILELLLRVFLTNDFLGDLTDIFK